MSTYQTIWILTVGAQMSFQKNVRQVSQLLLTTASVCCLGAGFAHAQGVATPSSASSASSGLETIVVTAEKRPENIQSAPVAITVISGSALANANITSLGQVTKLLPAVEIQTVANASNVYIRGVGQGTITDNAAPAIAFNVDGVFVPRDATGGTFFDLDRVQIAAGPQGTLYGRSATGGVINVTTAPPTDRFGGYVRLEGGNYGLFRGTAVLNVPVDDKLQLRGAVDYDRHNGYFSNGTDDLDSIGTRLSIRYRPIQGLTSLLVASYRHNGGLGEGLIAKPGASPGLSPSSAAFFSTLTTDPFKTSVPTTGWGDLFDGLFNGGNSFANDSRNWLVSWRLDYQLDDIDVKNIAGYVNYNTQLVNQYGLGVRLTQLNGNDYSDELRISNRTGKRNQWLIGLYGYKSNSYQAAFTNAPGNGFIPPRPSGRTGPVFLNTYKKGAAFFAQDRLGLLDWLHLIVGGRFSYDSENGGGSAVYPGSPMPPSRSFGGDTSSRHGDYRAVLQAQVAPHSMVYAGIQTGYLPGGFTLALLNSPAGVSHTFGIEKLTDYSIGTKNTFLDGKLRINDEFFYYDYKNYQQSQTTVVVIGTLRENVSQTFTAKKVAIYGDQFDMAYRFTPNDLFSFNGVWESPKFKDFVIPPSTLTVGAAGVYSGNQLPNAAELSFQTEYRHDFRLTSGADIAFSAFLKYDSGYWGTYNHAPTTHQGAFTIADVHLSYSTANGLWSAMAFADNVGDTRYYTVLSDASIPSQETLAAVGAPRTFGVILRRNF